MMSLAAFVTKHATQGPNKSYEHPDENRLLNTEDGVVELVASPFPEPVAGKPGFDNGRHLWVIMPTRLPVILETAPRVQPPQLTASRAKHTNLTGGRPACCGGELWVDAVDSGLLYVNGGSGRYQPRTIAELNDVVGVFESLGFRVISAGWNEDNGKPARVFRQS